MSDLDHQSKRRSLILAGGGVKVAFQAGVLEVWLDEAGLTFDHVDGASGGVFNLAMMCQGMNGRQIADNWRKADPVNGVAFNLKEDLKLFYARSIFTLDAYRRNVFSLWGLDWQKIRVSPLDATFNIYNFSRHELRVLPAAEMTEDFLCAAVSLPMWFPPIEIDNDLFIDAVYITDANVEAAIERGADEIWVIWTVRDKGDWQDGFVANYFHIIETSANGHFKRIAARIEKNNAALQAGEAGEFGRHIDLKILKADVALHYLINFSQDRVIEAVNSGVNQARRWCRDNNIPLNTPNPPSSPPAGSLTKLHFTEEMKGFATAGELDYDRGFRTGRKNRSTLAVRLKIAVEDVDRFLSDPSHEAVVTGLVEGELPGGKFPITKGTFNLLVDQEDTARKKMLYRLHFEDGEGKPFTLSGFKDITDGPGFDIWEDTTTLFVRVFEGTVGPEDEAGGRLLGAGIIRIQLLDFLRQLTTFRTEGPTLAGRTRALTAFGRLFLGKLWDVYARNILSSGPI